jgi:hypothetical protein
MFSTTYPLDESKQPRGKELYMLNYWSIVLRLKASKYECPRLLIAGSSHPAADITQQTPR